MTHRKPLKRLEELIPFSKDHHHGLLLCWKIRTGIKKGISLQRMTNYTEWFFKNYLLPHFELEEKYMFPILAEDNELVKRAISEHRQIERLISDIPTETNLLSMAEILESHIRFEERVLFENIQAVASDRQLGLIAEMHDGHFFSEHEDQFWI